MRETKKPSFVRLDRKTNEEVKTQTKYLCEVCHAVVLVTGHGMAAMAPNVQYVSTSESMKAAVSCQNRLVVSEYLVALRWMSQ